MKRFSSLIFSCMFVGSVTAQSFTESGEVNNETVEFAIYPNPGKHIVNIAFRDVLPDQIIVFDAAGRDVFLIKGLARKKARMDVSHWENGYYIVSMQFGETVVTSKLLVSHR